MCHLLTVGLFTFMNRSQYDKQLLEWCEFYNVSLKDLTNITVGWTDLTNVTWFMTHSVTYT